MPDRSCKVQGRMNDCAALTSAALTDNSGGTDPEDQTVAVITEAENTGSADLAPTANAIALLVAEFNKLRADVAALRAAITN